MELLLTPLVHRILRKIVKSSSEGPGGGLKASLSSGGVVLYNLELNLDFLFAGNQHVTVSRAFAKRLQIVIPWTALATQPVQVGRGLQQSVVCYAAFHKMRGEWMDNGKETAAGVSNRA
jgi:hypothetical protein